MQQEKLKKSLIFYANFCVFACSGFHKFANIYSEMKKILSFILISAVCIFNADAASRTENTKSRGKNTTITLPEKSSRSTTSRNAIKTTVSQRSAIPVTILPQRTTTKKTATRTPVSRTANLTTKNVTARATTTNQATTETRTGAEYEQCKEAFFSCMDQFCELKNDTFKRCSCNDRIFDFQDISETYQQANERLVEFSENLDVVGMAYDQAVTMKTASEGEDALAEDKSASKQLLQAIMNSIKGGDTSVGGKYKNLNSVTISADMSNAFGMEDSGQLIASYNGSTLYKAVYPKCRNAVKEDCNDASLQRAVNAYLMAIEQDCNSVEAALVAQQKSLKASTHQSSAMLDLARVENRKNHNSDDIATCIANVEKAIQSEEVCGEGYHKCLDNGRFIDVTTGKPLTGVADFYKLGEILTFRDNSDIKDQKLSSIQSNRTFVKYFENKTKKFAEDALDKCTEDADFVWQQYLDMALLDIYYAQQSKVKEIKQSCFDLVAQCYDNKNTAIANAMANLTGDSSLLLKPEAISLTKTMCNDYIESCNSMFANNIIQDYIATKESTDTKNACRGIVQQCFNKFGGTNYGNFYSKQNGLFVKGEALDWFTLYKKDTYNQPITDEDNNGIIVSPCAQQIAKIEECADKLEEIFGGFDKYYNTNAADTGAFEGYNYYLNSPRPGMSSVIQRTHSYNARNIRPTGVASEIYYEIMETLANNCNSLGGKFVKYEQATQYGYKADDLCKIDSNNADSVFYIDPVINNKRSLTYWYHFSPEENMCPSGYAVEVDTQSWGICSCWENGGYRSKNGTIPTCRPIIPATTGPSTTEDETCSAETLCKENETVPDLCAQPRSNTSQYWCQQSILSSRGQLCPTVYLDSDSWCATSTGETIDTVKDKVPERIR